MFQFPALKIKLKPRKEQVGLSSTTLHNESQSLSPANQQPANSSHFNSDGDGKEGSLRRKNQSPASSSVSKRMCREDSDSSGESPEADPASAGQSEVFSERCEQISAEPLVIKQRLGSQHASIAALIEGEHQSRVEDDDARSTRPRSAALALENISHGQLQVISVVPSSSLSGRRQVTPGQEDMGPVDPVARASLDAALSQQCYPFAAWTRPGPQPLREHRVAVLPAHASWFAWDRIHKLERQAMPQFFFGKSKLQSAEAFMQARNAVIMKYRSNPHIPIGVMDVREGSMIGDKESGQIVEFLIQWGLVNYQAELNVETAGIKYPTKVPVFFTEDTSGVLNMPQLSLTSLEYLYRFDPLRAPSMSLKCSAMDDEPSTLAAESVVKEAGGTAYNGSLGSLCSACVGDCFNQHFYCEKQADYILCQDCYSNGNLGIGMTTADFTAFTGHSEGTDNFDSSNWSDQETLMLLEALEVNGDNWTEVAEFVGTKSKAQCISHFIGLSIEDRFFEDMEVPHSFTRDRPHHTELHLQEEMAVKCIDLEAKLPVGSDKPEPTADLKNPGKPQYDSDMYVAFEGANNPVMSLVAFLAATVGPRVAAVAAHAALSSLSEEYKVTRLAADGHDQPMLANSAGPTDMADGGNEREKNEVEMSNHDIVDDQQSQLSRDSMRKVTSGALATAAMKTKLLADQEEREVQRLAAIIVDNQLKKLSTKLKQLGDIDSFLEKDRDQMERNRQRISAERLRVLSTRLGATGSTSQMPVVGNQGLMNMRPSGPLSPSPVMPAGGGMPSGAGMPSGGVMPVTGVLPAGGLMPAGSVLPTHMLPPNLFNMGPGVMAIPVSSPMIKPPS